MERNKKSIGRVTRLRMKYLENVSRTGNSQRFDRRRESFFGDSEWRDTEGKQFARSWIIRRGFAFQDIMPILAASRV